MSSMDVALLATCRCNLPPHCSHTTKHRTTNRSRLHQHLRHTGHLGKIILCDQQVTLLCDPW